MRSPSYLLVLVTTLGCSPSGKVDLGPNDPDGTDDGLPADSGDSGGTTAPDDSGEPTDTGETDDSVDIPLDIDCSALPSEPLVKEQVEGARGYHGLVFDDDGYIIGWDGRSGLVGALSDGTSQLMVPGVDSAEQMVRLDDGRTFVVNQWEFGVDLITPDGGRSAFVRGLTGEFPYGITLGPDGKLYVVDGNIHRLDPDTAELTEIYTHDREWDLPHAVGFSLDSRTLYISMIGDGWMFAAELDENLDLVGEPEPFAYLEGGWQDTAAVDICGNIYVADYYMSRLYRVSSDGTAEVFVQAREAGYMHGLTWGTGKDGWDALSVYAPMPYARNSVNRYEIGVADGKYVREWNGVKVGR